MYRHEQHDQHDDELRRSSSQRRYDYGRDLETDSESTYEHHDQYELRRREQRDLPRERGRRGGARGAGRRASSSDLVAASARRSRSRTPPVPGALHAGEGGLGAVRGAAQEHPGRARVSWTPAPVRSMQHDALQIQIQTGHEIRQMSATQVIFADHGALSSAMTVMEGWSRQMEATRTRMRQAAPQQAPT